MSQKGWHFINPVHAELARANVQRVNGGADICSLSELKMLVHIKDVGRQQTEVEQSIQ